MAKYETMLITSAALDEEATAALVGNCLLYTSHLTRNGGVLLLYGAKRGEKFSQTVQNGLKSGGLL